MFATKSYYVKKGDREWDLKIKRERKKNRDGRKEKEGVKKERQKREAN